MGFWPTKLPIKLAGMTAACCLAAAGCASIAHVELATRPPPVRDVSLPDDTQSDERPAAPNAWMPAQATSDDDAAQPSAEAIPFLDVGPPLAQSKILPTSATVEHIEQTPARNEPIDVAQASHLQPEQLAPPLALIAPPIERLTPPLEQVAPPTPEPIESAPSVDCAAMTIELGQALAMASGQSPHIAAAVARYHEAYAQYHAAKTLWLPSIRAGVSYNHHDGQIQDVGGRVINVNRSGLNAGLGTRAVGAGSPAAPGVLATFHASDAIFAPKIAAHTLAARDAASAARTNDTLLATALAYLELQRSTQLLSIAQQTQTHAQELADLTAKFSSTGQGAEADANRAQTELMRRRNDVTRAEEAVAVAGARLAELLSLDPTTLLLPAETTIVPVDLTPGDADPRNLVATALGNRPELAEAEQLVCEAVERYRREKYAPLVPSVLLGISHSGFGGGIGRAVANFDGRFDFDAAAYWELRNAGFGEAARREESMARYDEALAQQGAVLDRVAREVVEAHTQVRSRQKQIAVAEEGVAAATNSFQRNVGRIREGEGLPLEVLQSLQALDEAQREYVRTLVDHNEAQFRLQRALGWAIQ